MFLMFSRSRASQVILGLLLPLVAAAASTPLVRELEHKSHLASRIIGVALITIGPAVGFWLIATWFRRFAVIIAIVYFPAR